MTQLAKWLYLLTLSAWIGSVIFFSFIVAPTVFKVLKPEDAARLQRTIFPRYYLLGIICAGSGLVCMVWLVASRSWSVWPGVLSLLLLSAAGSTDFWLRQVVVPRMNVLRDQRAADTSPSAEVEQEWHELHQLSVRLNGAVLLGGLALLFLVVFSHAA